MKFMPFISKIKNQRGSSSMMLCMSLTLLCCVAIIVVINLFQMYSLNIKAQTVCDSIADGAAVAGQNPTGFDRDAAKKVANDLVVANNMGTAPVITFSEELSGGYPTGYELVTVNYKAKTRLYSADSFSVDQFTVSGHSVVRAEVPNDAENWIPRSFFRESYREVPFTTTGAGKRNPAYVTWFIKYYLCPQYNPVYQPSGVLSKGNEFIYDYLRCMGLSSTEITPLPSDQWLDYFVMSGGWHLETEVDAIKSAANSGQPVVMLSIQGYDLDMCAVVPETSLTKADEIATAQAGLECWNSRNIDYEQLKKDADAVYVFTRN